MARSTTADARNCPECGGRLRRDDEETVCAECGLVTGEHRIDHGPEWRSFTEDGDSKERTGAPRTRSRHDRGLSTEIGRDTALSGRKRRRLARMRTQHDRARIASKADRNQVYGFTEIRRLVGALSLPRDVREQACVLFESAQDADLLRGRSLEGFAAAAVYAVCRTRSLARRVDEVADAARADESELRAAYDAMNADLGLPTGPVDPREYLPRFADELDLPPGVQRRAADLVGVAEDRNAVVGRNPCGVAAGCLYAAARERGHDCTQAAAADVADVAPATLRATYRELAD